jgi:hypothetical protein
MYVGRVVQAYRRVVGVVCVCSRTHALAGRVILIGGWSCTRLSRVVGWMPATAGVSAGDALLTRQEVAAGSSYAPERPLRKPAPCVANE